MVSVKEAKHIMARQQKPSGSANPVSEEKVYIPFFVPAGYPPGSDKMLETNPITGIKEEKPVHVMDITTRGQILKDWLDDGMRSGNVGAVYKAYFYTALCAVLALVTLSFSPYVAAVFAYLTGHFWSERLLNDAWGVEWFKGKALIYAK